MPPFAKKSAKKEFRKLYDTSNKEERNIIAEELVSEMRKNF